MSERSGMQGLCIFRGCLVIAEFKKREGDTSGCSKCRKPVTLHNGWVWCFACDFAVLESDLERMNNSK